MSSAASVAATIPGVAHHVTRVDGADLHYVSAGTTGSPVLLVHGFPETWWAFHRLIPLLAETHRVFALDLPGFGDSGVGGFDSAAVAGMLHGLIGELGAGPVHITAQDVAGSTVFRLARTHPGDLLSFTAIETVLPGFGWEALADLAHGGAWHIGVLGMPGIPEMLLTGREREFIGGFAFPAMTAVQGSITEKDIDEFVRTYSRPRGFEGATGLYRSLLTEGDEIAALDAETDSTVPVLAIGAGGGGFTAGSFSQTKSAPTESVLLEGVGHYAALEAPDRLTAAILPFLDRIDAER